MQSRDSRQGNAPKPQIACKPKSYLTYSAVENPGCAQLHRVIIIFQQPALQAVLAVTAELPQHCCLDEGTALDARPIAHPISGLADAGGPSAYFMPFHPQKT